ncbi:16S rRNA (uracil(1498)-N(3))-methyltransferase [Candidatus Woesearchaeota archaeon]|nr:16S rRNA (uracil(1498)-N(3))-methyltransferase [Candidatus Woesearchaeota archaeon]
MRIFNPEAKLNGRIRLSGEQQRHAKVLRLKKGEIIGIFDGLGNEYQAVYSGKVSDPLILDKKVSQYREPDRKITLMTAAAKGNRMDFLVEKATELGVSELVPIVCERSVVKPKEGKIERWKKIAIEACCQSGRTIVPNIQETVAFEQAIEKVRGKAFICDKDGNIAHYEGKEITLIVGPEGGFTEKELEMAENKGIKRIKLANSILRIETAGIVAIAQFVQ